MDEGEGIPEGELDSIFNEFKQSAKAKSGSFQQSTGLGLAICREIVHAHGGEIWATNGASGGAEIHFTLPMHDANTVTMEE